MISFQCSKITCVKWMEIKPLTDGLVSSVPFLVRRVDGKGLGVVASRDIEPGQLIMSETALILARRETSECLTVNQARQIFKQAAMLNKVQKSKLMDLHCLEERKVLDIFKNNCIHVDDHNIGLFLLISRINHSCCPNSIVCQGTVKEVRAMKFIKKGEEITMTYIVNTSDNKEKREQDLRYWQFECDCEVCSLSGKTLLDNDQIRDQITEKDLQVSKFVDNIIVVQDNLEMISEDSQRLMQCNIYVNLLQMARVAEDTVDLMYRLKDQMLRQLFSAHLHVLLLYYKALGVNIINVEETNTRVKKHVLKLERMVDWCKDWRPLLAETVGRGIMFSMKQLRGVGCGYHYS